MTSAAARPGRSRRLPPAVKRLIALAAIALLLVLMALNTKFVPKGSTLGQGPAVFNAAAYGKKQFPIQQKYIVSKAVDATTLAAALAKDPTAAGKQYGTPNNEGAGPEIAVKFTGKVGKTDATGLPTVAVPGVPSSTQVHVQLGPAINGTDLRDASGKITLGQFENQIQYQDAASALNDQLKRVLTKAGAPNLTGKTITVDGVFQLINPKNWQVTPATLSVNG
jgi:predicted lipoprotein